MSSHETHPALKKITKSIRDALAAQEGCRCVENHKMVDTTTGIITCKVDGVRVQVRIKAGPDRAQRLLVPAEEGR